MDLLDHLNGLISDLVTSPDNKISAQYNASGVLSIVDLSSKVKTAVTTGIMRPTGIVFSPYILGGHHLLVIFNTQNFETIEVFLRGIGTIIRDPRAAIMGGIASVEFTTDGNIELTKSDGSISKYDLFLERIANP